MSDEIGHYRIRQKLGSGGMGDVYLAEDMKLHRMVALKVLPADVSADAHRRSRFFQEAHAASVLSHPNVSTIYEVGEHGDTVFIAMEYIDGLTLTQVREARTPGVDEVIDIALQTADALDEAAARGIVHRDIKSANIMLTARGHVKVLDFGLAKLRAAESEEDGGETKIKTSPGLVMGTPYYMSPEQALGRTVDHRSDLFSLGIVLYELVTGKLPFTGATTTETIQKITNVEPDPIARFNYSVPLELERIIRKLLEKDASRRYQSARDLIVDLKNLKRDSASGEMSSRGVVTPPQRRKPLAAIAGAVALLGAVIVAVLMMRGRGGAAAADTIDSIAVMPFVNVSGAADSEYLSDGISESIINDLSRISGLRVVPRSTVFRHKGKESDLVKVAEELKVRAIVAGRVLQRGDVLSVQAELIDAKSNSQLWGARYERKAGDALALQEEISKQIIDRLREPGSTGKVVAASPGRTTRDPEAYQLYLKGRYHWGKRTGESLAKALGYYEQALVRDPDFALAHVGVAETHLLLEQYADRPMSEGTDKAEQSIRRALAINEQIAEAHASLGMIHGNRAEWDAAEKAFHRSIELNPDYPTARHWYNIHLRQLGRIDEALAQVRKAQQLDPLSMIIGVNLVEVLKLKGQHEEALRTAEKYLELDPNFAQMLNVASGLYSRAGRHPEAIAASQKAVSQSGEVAEQLANLAVVYIKAGDREAAMPLMRRVQERVARGEADAYYLAKVHAALGERDKTFEALDLSLQRSSGMMHSLKVEEDFVPLRSDPRFSKLLRQMGMPES